MNSIDLNEDQCSISEQEVQNIQIYQTHKYNTTGGEK
jgi:hypothetical protein